MARDRKLNKLLERRFHAAHVDALLRHFRAMMSEYQSSAWEEAISKAGKFVEAVLKALWLHAGNALPPARKFKAGEITKGLTNLPVGSLSDALRITIPRACDFTYDIASNRGARHDPDEVDPNQIDATVVVATSSWIVAEMLRYAQGGASEPRRVLAIVSGLSQRRYPQIEEVDGRVYFHFPGISARKVALLAMWQQHPRRIAKLDLIAAIARHHFSPENARKAVARLTRVVDEDTAGGLRLLQPGLAEAESLIGREFSVSSARS